MGKKSCCFIKSRRRAVNKAKYWPMREVGLASLMDTSLLLASASSDYNLLLAEGHC